MQRNLDQCRRTEISPNPDPGVGQSTASLLVTNLLKPLCTIAFKNHLKFIEIYLNSSVDDIQIVPTQHIVLKTSRKILGLSRSCVTRDIPYPDTSRFAWEINEGYYFVFILLMGVNRVMLHLIQKQSSKILLNTYLKLFP